MLSPPACRQHSALRERAYLLVGVPHAPAYFLLQLRKLLARTVQLRGSRLLQRLRGAQLLLGCACGRRLAGNVLLQAGQCCFRF